MDRSPSLISASKSVSSRARRSGLLARAALLLLVSGCETAYPLPATTCDDYCRAVQRADCDDDAPADCVRECERERSVHACDSALVTLNECYMHSDPSAFFCAEDQSRVDAICLSERRTLDECLSPGSGPCVDECIRQSDTCQGSFDDCEQGCRHPAAGCEDVSRLFYGCLQDYPVECREWLQMDTVQSEDVPCEHEALELLACYE